MSGPVKFLLAALIGAGVITGAGAVYVFVLAPPSVQRATAPASYSATGTSAQQNAEEKALCEATVKELGSANITPLCKQILAEKSPQ